MNADIETRGKDLTEEEKDTPTWVHSTQIVQVNFHYGKAASAVILRAFLTDNT